MTNENNTPMKFSYQRIENYEELLKDKTVNIEDVYDIILNFLKSDSKLSPKTEIEMIKGLLIIQGFLLKNGDCNILNYCQFLNFLFKIIENQESTDLKNISLDIIESYSLKEDLSSDFLDIILNKFKNSFIKTKCMEIYFIHYLRNKTLEEKLFKMYGIQFAHEFINCPFENLSSISLNVIQ